MACSASILDGRLRDLVLRAADGWLPGVALLITTRFRLFDPLAERCALYREIGIDQLQPPAALALLGARGVTRTTDAQLLALAEESGFHALTLDLLGGYVAAFCDGDPVRLPPLAEVKVPDEAAADDPRLAAVKEQERKFSRLAQRYREALAASDPAALALMERVCLFRLGVNADMLAAIFTGVGKENISGAALAVLNREQVGKKLRRLAQMRLLDENRPPSTPNSKSTQPMPNYTVHPAVRDGFLHGLDGDAARQGHEAAREGLITSLGGLPGSGSNPSDPAALDLLEEIVYHTLGAGHLQEAWEIYWNRIGGSNNLLWRLGAFERGERICRAFVGGRLPERSPASDRSSSEFGSEASRSIGSLADLDQARCINDLALFLEHLGHLAASGWCYEQALALIQGDAGLQYASIVNQHLAEVWSLVGNLTRALKAADEALRLAKCANEAWEWCDAYARRARARALRGETDAALADFRDALDWQHEADRHDDRPLYSNRGIWLTLLLADLRRNEEAIRLTQENDRTCAEIAGSNHMYTPHCRLALADLARNRGELDKARMLQEQAYEWAVAHDAREVLCWATLVRARIALTKVSCFHHETRARQGIQESGVSKEGHARVLEEARSDLDEGLHLARDCGYGIYHIDLMLERARLHLLRGEPQPAMDDLRVALDDGLEPPLDSGFPTLLAATDPECGYAWGIAEGRHLRAQAFLLQATQTLGRPDFAPANFTALPAEVRSLIESARDELKECRELRKRIQDPKMRDTEQVLKDLKGGLLTLFPLATSEPTDGRQNNENKDAMPTTKRDTIFVSYSHKDKKLFEEFKTMLAPALQTGAVDLWDDTKIRPGAKWKDEIQAAIDSARVVVLLVSQNFLASDFIAKHELPPLLKAAQDEGVTVFWVYFSSCLFEQTEIAAYQAAHDVSRPLDRLGKPQRQAALSEICAKLVRLAR